MKKTVLAAISALSLAVPVYAAPAFAGGGFNLNAVSANDLNGTDFGAAVPPAASADALQFPDKSPNMPAPVLDMSLRLPFLELNKRLAGMPGQVQVLDPSAPLLAREGDHLVFRNITVNMNGIEAEPVITFRPVFEGGNRLAVKFMKVEADIVMGPKALAMPRLDKNGVMALAVEKITDGVKSAMNAALAKNRVEAKAEDFLSFSYDKLSWTLRAQISPRLAAPLLPGLLDNISLNEFSFDDKSFTIGARAGSGGAAAQLPGYNLALSDGLLTNFLLKYTAGTDFELTPKGHDGGIKFRQDGRLEVAGKLYARDVFLKPDVYFTATILPALTADNTLKIRIEKINIDQAYGIGLPGFINGWLQGKIITSTIETITGNQALARVIKARRLDDRTVELKMENTAFLPSFAQGVTIKNLRVAQGLLRLGFGF